MYVRIMSNHGKPARRCQHRYIFHNMCHILYISYPYMKGNSCSSFFSKLNCHLKKANSTNEYKLAKTMIKLWNLQTQLIFPCNLLHMLFVSINVNNLWLRRSCKGDKMTSNNAESFSYPTKWRPLRLQAWTKAPTNGTRFESITLHTANQISHGNN